MYNGKEVNSSTPQYLRAYVSQYDLHHAEMTIRETIDFSSKMLGTNNEFGETPSCLWCDIPITNLI
jgi:ABC-type multidrug transport system ATPase subunit